MFLQVSDVTLKHSPGSLITQTPEQHVWIHPPLKIVRDKLTISSCVGSRSVINTYYRTNQTNITNENLEFFSRFSTSLSFQQFIGICFQDCSDSLFSVNFCFWLSFIFLMIVLSLKCFSDEMKNQNAGRKNRKMTENDCFKCNLQRFKTWCCFFSKYTNIMWKDTRRTQVHSFIDDSVLKSTVFKQVKLYFCVKDLRLQ